MSSHTFQTRLCAGLESLGYHKVEARPGKYIAYTKQNWDEYFFVGKAGALRKGRCASKSYSIGDPASRSLMYNNLLELGAKKLATTQPTSVADRLSTLD